MLSKNLRSSVFDYILGYSQDQLRKLSLLFIFKHLKMDIILKYYKNVVFRIFNRYILNERMLHKTNTKARQNFYLW